MEINDRPFYILHNARWWMPKFNFSPDGRRVIHDERIVQFRRISPKAENHQQSDAALNPSS